MLAAWIESNLFTVFQNYSMQYCPITMGEIPYGILRATFAIFPAY